MEGNIFNIPMDMSFQNSLINDATFPLSHSNSQDPNTQNPIMSAFPVLSMLQGEPICDLNTGLHLPNQNPNPNPNSAAALIHNQFMNGMPISAASLATLLAARYNNNPQENLNDNIIIPSTFPHPNEVMRPNGFCDTNTMISDYPPLMGFSPFQLLGNLEPNRWISSENNTSVSSCSNELSLSLGNCQPICSNANSDRELSCSGLSEQGQNRNLCLGFGSSKPVEFSEVLSGSGYLHVMREILSEIASFSLDDNHRTSYTAAGGIGGGANPSSSSSRNEFCDGDERSEGHIQPFFRSQEVESKKKHMLDLLEAVDNRYNRCMDEIHTVISAFHAVTDLDPQIHARFAIQTVSVMYKNLRERISNYILAMGTNSRRGISSGRREETEEKSFESSFIQKQWALQQLKRKDHQLWRPQRGLPEKSVAVLRAWMFQNFLHPYPKDAEKHLLAVKSGLTRSQVSNWFINARVRLWKPMIEEMYTEMNRRKNRRNDQGSNPRSNFLNNISIDYERFKMI